MKKSIHHHKKENKVASSFSVKRKQINFNLLDTPISRNSSSGSLFHHHPLQHAILPESATNHISTTSAINKDIYDHLLNEKDEKINELKKELQQVNQELQTTRHEYRLMANERSEFESNIIEKCSKEKQAVELELKILKETHVEKLQSLSCTLNGLSNTVIQLREQLKKHNIQEETSQEDINSLLLAESNHYKKDAQFIQDAYYKVKQETHIHHPLWSNIQYTTSCIKHEIDQFQAWKSIPVADLTRLLREDQQQKSSVKSLLFGRLNKNKQ